MTAFTAFETTDLHNNIGTQIGRWLADHDHLFNVIHACGPNMGRSVSLSRPADPLHARFLVENVLPYISERFPLRQDKSFRGLMGASFGAVASLSSAWRHQGEFGRLLLQSGSFAFTDIGVHQRGPAFDPIVPFMNEFRDHPGKPADKLFISCGTYESLIYENRSLVPLLQSTGMVVKYQEARDGHNWENWRDHLRAGLSWLFPGPLWMVYE